MNRKTDIITAKGSFATALLLIAIVMSFLAPKAAVNVDEQLHYPHAKKVVNWYFTGGKDTSCLNTPDSNLKYYGQSVDNMTALVVRVFNIKNEFLTRHFTGAAFFLLLLFFSGLLAHQITGSYWSSVITVFVLVFMPRLFGQAFGNLKDIPFATGYIAGLYMIIRYLKELPKPRWSTTFLLGIAIAFTCSVRIGGLILFAYLALFGAVYFILKPFELKQIVSTKPCFVRLMGQITAIILIGYFAGLLFWPYALQNVFLNPWESLKVMEHYKIGIRQVFEGNFIWSTDLPWYYLPKWLFISTPEFVFIGIIFFLVFFIKEWIEKNMEFNRILFETFIVFSFFFPLVYVIFIHSNLYSGIRQMIFVLPLLAVMTSIAIYKLWDSNFKKIIKYPVLIVLFLLMIIPIKHQASNFPADYIYFNSFIGGNKKAWSNYEYDYYFHGIKEPAEYLIQLIKHDEDVIVAANCNLSNYFTGLPNVCYRYVRYLERSSVNWDYGLFGINYIHPYQLKNKTWQSAEVLKTFYHEGNPIAVILKRKDKKDLEGINYIELKKPEEGERLLEQALDRDPNNIWLYVYLIKAKLLQGQNETADLYIKKGRELHPFYEPFYLLEAQKLFNENKFHESLVTLQKLIEINPRYQPAGSLLKAVKDKLNK